MTDRDPIWDALKAHSKGKFDADRERFLSQAVAGDDGGWTKHTEFHWSRMVAGSRLDYWPSRKKFQFDGRVMRGDVQKFIRQKSDESDVTRKCPHGWEEGCKTCWDKERDSLRAVNADLLAALNRSCDALDRLTDKVDGTGFSSSDEFNNALDEIDLGRAAIARATD